MPRLSRPFAPLLLLGALALAGPSAGAGPTAHASRASVVLNLQGGYRSAELTRCGIRHHYTYYHRRRRIGFNGHVLPAPRKPWRVKIKIKKCVSGRFVTVKQFHVFGNSRGGFDGSFRVRRRGSYFARAYFYRTSPPSRSDKEFFRATR